MTSLQKWQLLSQQDVSPSPFFPIEKRSYRRPDGQIVEDFYVTTLADVVHVVPITTDGRVVMIRLYKQGADEIMLQFPAGRFEVKKHADWLTAAVTELAEETGITVAPEQLEFIRSLGVMTTKATEKVHLYLVRNVTLGGTQQLDENEEIEVVALSPAEIDAAIASGEIWDMQVIANWTLVKAKLAVG